MPNIILVRHCEANGQERDAQLTSAGFQQAKELARFLEHYNSSKIISSPFTRAVQTITPYATNKNITIELDERLAERVLSSKNMPDWLTKLEQSFYDLDVAFPGGESSNKAKQRIVTLLDELVHTNDETIVLVTHGNLAALLLHSISQTFGFEGWQKLSNPDVYLLEAKSNGLTYRRIWT